MANKRILLIGGVYRIPGNLKHAGPVMADVCDELEPELSRNGYVQKAPFDTVSLIFRFGQGDQFDPEIGNIDKRHSELPVAIAFDFARLKKMDRAMLRQEFRMATLEVLCDVAANFDLPFHFLDKLRVLT